MALTPEQHLEIASAYESAASDASLPEEQRARFAKKAESFRLLAKLAAKQTASARQRVRTPIDASELRRQIFEHLEKKRSTPNQQRAEPETPPHIQALEQLALRWRLFKLETRTFGRYAPLHPRPSGSTPAGHWPGGEIGRPWAKP
ncbi:hypothetical protein [Methyloceanibacter sp.]|uniref:hypothetical protein n=1 Tax=Methyloceanibacter sp. TaxID=1965321 RepID=UPI002D27D786|nr:hypothetical protein [Methyloceanibacter sp.]HZP08927.1 hypothetical protein [Methyloceanibacter sp.]